LEPHITVERLAIKLNVSPKLLSCTINNQMKMNFFELIGTYRVAEAKKRLADSALRQKPIAEIMKSCGFNSKSVFNQAFKKTVGVTPSHYRQQHLL
jgi:AraC-like DNA-binding protein